ncbi:hypothetical protein Q9L58_007448 [Maublancomyces gigas]|uniref:Uncharacterized protein n=1 Tax=Discina gigas TaxID=1032678 RepID=A0ABR3GCD8_9PEZI
MRLAQAADSRLHQVGSGDPVYLLKDENYGVLVKIARDLSFADCEQDISVNWSGKEGPHVIDIEEYFFIKVEDHCRVIMKLAIPVCHFHGKSNETSEKVALGRNGSLVNQGLSTIFYEAEGSKNAPGKPRYA